MTDKEMAEEYFEELRKKKISFNIPNVNKEIKQAFLAGLKAGSKLDKVWHDYDAGEDCYEDTHEGRWVKRESGRPEWHDLRKNPTDLPERINSTSPISKTVLNQIGTSCYYHYGLKCWHNWSFTKIATPIAWCEIPTFTDKE